MYLTDFTAMNENKLINCFKDIDFTNDDVNPQELEEVLTSEERSKIQKMAANTEAATYSNKEGERQKTKGYVEGLKIKYRSAIQSKRSRKVSK